MSDKPLTSQEAMLIEARRIGREMNVMNASLPSDITPDATPSINWDKVEEMQRGGGIKL